MSDLRKRYFSALKEVAIGMFVTPFRSGFFGDFGKAASDFGWHLSMFAVWLLSLATYPVSIFLFAGLAVYSDTLRQRAIKKADDEWRQGMHRFGVDK